MKIFVVLLLLANLGGWGWVAFGRSEADKALPNKLPEAVFLPAREELKLFDVAKAELKATTVDSDLVDSVGGPDDPSRQSIDVATVAVPMQEPWCGLSSAFETEVDASNWLSGWTDLGGVGSVIQREEQVSSTWWVHLPPFPTESAARTVLLELQEKKIDSFYMRTGELAGGISLGVFSREESALLVRKDMESKGYLASVREIPRMAMRFLVAAELPDKVLLARPDLMGFLNRSGYVEMPCK